MCCITWKTIVIWRTEPHKIFRHYMTLPLQLTKMNVPDLFWRFLTGLCLYVFLLKGCSPFNVSHPSVITMTQFPLKTLFPDYGTCACSRSTFKWTVPLCFCMCLWKQKCFVKNFKLYFLYAGGRKEKSQAKSCQVH